LWEDGGVAFRVIQPVDFEWETRPAEEGEPRRHVALLTEPAGFVHSRANVWRYEPGASGRRHKEMVQEETFIVLGGTLSLYLGDPPLCQEVVCGGLVHVDPGTALQIVNEGSEDLVLYIYGAPPERGHAEFLDSAV
jgi:quercetin dioxygenase-like cupin family protein